MGDKVPDLVVAIDFGTTYSGYAYSFQNDLKSMRGSTWNSPFMLTGRTPTTVLIEPKKMNLDSFGYKALEKYEALSDDEKKTYFFFHRFKMNLYEKVVDQNLILYDETNKPLSAKTVFSLAIKYLKERIKRKITPPVDRRIDWRLVLWVLTIPAIWSDAAKQFMREAAIEAGIEDKQVTIALEPEVASLFCRHMSFSEMELNMPSFTPGSKYMLIDAGGGTVDISVHEVLEGGDLKELHEASGGGWGGIRVDEAFIQYISELTGKSSFEQVKKDKPGQYLELLNAFERSKRSFKKKDENAKIFIPCEFRAAIPNSKKVEFLGDKLEVEASEMNEFFSESIDRIVTHVKMLMRDTNVKDITFIVMVGGFSMCKLLQNKIKSSFAHANVFIPEEADLAVVKGSVLYGYNPTVFKQRVCRKTYGIGTCKLFDPKEHDEKKKVSYDGTLYCSDIFDVHVNVGQTVTFNEIQSERSYVPISENQESVVLDIYESSDKIIKYVTDSGCQKIGTIAVNISDRSVPRRDRKVIVSMMFSGTEIKVFAKEKKTGKSKEVCVDFLKWKSELKNSAHWVL